MKQPGAILEPRGRVILEDYIVDIAWAPDSSRLAVAGGEGKVFLATREKDRLDSKIVGDHGLGALAIAWQPGGERFASSGQDSRLLLFDGTGNRVAERRPSMTATACVAWSGDGQRLSSAAGKQISLWTSELEPVHVFEPQAATITALAWDKSGRDLAASMNGGLVVHRIDPPRFAVRYYKWSAPCLTAAFSPNGKFLATGTQDGSVHFWYLATGRDSQMRGYPGKVDSTVWSGDSRYLATAADDQVVVWDFGGKGPEGSRPLQLRGHTDRIECMAFQPKGNFLVTGGRDWRISLWFPGKSTLALDAQLTDSEPSCLRWSPDGRFIALGEQRGSLSIFELVRIV
jgi:WD40 repeat protein